MVSASCQSSVSTLVRVVLNPIRRARYPEASPTPPPSRSRHSPGYAIHENLINYTWRPGYCASCDVSEIADYFTANGLLSLGFNRINCEPRAAAAVPHCSGARLHQFPRGAPPQTMTASSSAVTRPATSSPIPPPSHLVCARQRTRCMRKGFRWDGIQCAASTRAPRARRRASSDRAASATSCRTPNCGARGGL